MKKFILLLITLSVLSLIKNADAQTKQGSTLIGANLTNINLTFLDGDTPFNLGISPKVGYFFRDNVVIGAEVNLGLTTSEDFRNFTYSVGPFGRYYFNNEKIDVTVSQRSLFFAEANAGFQGTNVKSGGEKSNNNGLGLGAGVGLAYFVSPTVGLETSLKYNFGVGFGNATFNNQLALNVGFNIYLPARSIRDQIKTETDR